MINIILAIDSKNGMGKNNILPWKLQDELNIFKEKTLNGIVIAGRKTVEELPYLKDRLIFCISRKFQTLKSDKNLVCIFKSIEDALHEAKNHNKNIFIIGGNQIYDYAFKNFKNDLKIHISFIKESYDCDTYFNIKNIEDFYITHTQKYDSFDHYEMVYKKHGEIQYLKLIENILNNGEKRIGRNGNTFSDFGKHLKFDLRDGFPLLTTKKMFIKGIIEELLFFLRGDTNTKILEEKGINIWKGNTNREFLDNNGFKERTEGFMGPMYGHVWRYYGSEYNEKTGKCIIDENKYIFLESIFGTYKSKGLDQLQNVINEIRNNPTSRRILLTTYNPSIVDQGVLYPCHSIIIQFYVQDGFLDMFCYNRSSDTFLGLPFNIASTSLFLMLIAKITNLTPRYFNLSLGDVHIYSSHIKQVEEQITRLSYNFPTIILPNIKELSDIDILSSSDFILENYLCHTPIKAEMIA